MGLLHGCGDDSAGGQGDAGADGGIGRCSAHADCEDDLSCIDGVCRMPNCVPGATGCVCDEDTPCQETGDACTDGFCMPDGCSAGSEDCACRGTGCDPGLHCLDGAICVDNAGYEGGPCLANGRCNSGNACDPWLEVCVHCKPGSQGCECDEDERCSGSLTCTTGLCAVSGYFVPDNPLCYTPCQQDLESDDGVRRCDSEGLLEGCVDGRECKLGSCVQPGEDPPTCTTDMQCPAHQICIQSRCYSNCEGHADCPDGLSCDRKVCRVACSSNAPAAEQCPTRMFCETVDGSDGFCRELAKPADESQMSLGANVTIKPERLTFSNVQTTGETYLTLEGPLSKELTIRKLSHTIYYRDGSVETQPAAEGDNPDDCEGSSCPLWWLDVAGRDDFTKAQSFITRVDSECQRDKPCTLYFKNAGALDATRWKGEIEISGPGMNARKLTVSYVSRPDGRWEGAMYYFGTFGDTNLEDWIATPSDAQIERVNNGLLRVWHAYRKGRLTGGWEQFEAVLTATTEGSWNWRSTKEACRVYDAANPDQGGACYLFDDGTGGDGTRTYVSSLEEAPIPTGAIEFPLSLNLWIPDATKPQELEGRINTDAALHYPAMPAFAMKLSADASDSAVCDGDGIATDCVNLVSMLQADIYTGGRFLLRPDADGNTAPCPAGYREASFPWLVPGFTSLSAAEESGPRTRRECRRETLPFDAMGDESIKALNAAMAGANPIPDGVGRARKLRFIDGALINQDQLFVLFKEEFDPFLSKTDPEAAFSAYGYMILRREVTDLETGDGNDNGVPDAYEGNDLSMAADEPSNLGVVCADGLLPDPDAPAEDLVSMLIDGEDPSSPSVPIAQSRVHYICHDTGVIDGGSDDTGVDPSAIPCTPGSNVTFFVVDPAINKDTLLGHPCNDAVVQVDLSGTFDIDDQVMTDSSSDTIFSDGSVAVKWEGGTCLGVVKEWAADGTYGTQLDPVWRCDRNIIPEPDENGEVANATVVFQNQGLHCDNRYDLVENKEFFEPSGAQAPLFAPLLDDVPEAFRYKTRFQSSSGGQIGFAPEICVPNSDQIPYCYDPLKIEEIRDRTDCLLKLYGDDDAYMRLETLAAGTDPDTMLPLVDANDPKTKLLDKLHAYLKKNFKVEYITVPNLAAPLQEPGFERLFAELMITMGDESLTAAFASRFDLAGAGGAAFEGSRFEPDGIDLSGVAGFEMHSLYQSVQYYQEVLDRFYLMSPVMWSAMQRGDVESPAVFITPNTVTTYFDKLVRASTQKARAWSEVAKRYQGFNRPDLARGVVERAYVSTYLESGVLSQLISRVLDLSKSKDRAQLLKTVEDAMRRYRMAMLDMSTVYTGITDDITFFGFEPDYVPFPALDSNTSQNAFEVLLQSAKAKTQFAADRERLALESNRSLKTDQATFQAELTRIRNNYENQLGDVCGTMVARDGRIYPAIEKYAHLNDRTALVGDPCGQLGNGDIYQALQTLEIATLTMKSALGAYDKIIDLIEIEKDLVEEQCAQILDASEHVFDERGELLTLFEQTREAAFMKEKLGRALQRGIAALTMADCETITLVIPTTPPMILPSSTCPQARAAAAFIAVSSATTEINTHLAEEQILEAQAAAADLQNDISKWDRDSQCEMVKIQGRAEMKRLRLALADTLVDGLRAEYGIRQSLGEVVRRYNEGQRLQAEQKEAEQLQLNVEAARNDPNVRIYRNDAVINADIAFTDAIREAYRATRVFEYYTSQSYASIEKLFLTRMVTAGDFNLENYLIELEEAFFQFEDSFGKPDTRVMIVSLRDDIMNVPHANGSGDTLSEGARIDMMRAGLKDPALLNSKGYIELPFSTKLAELSPLTRDHKLLYVEADVIGSSVGDNVGRIYLRQLGTGTIFDVTGGKQFFRFPERTGVINPVFNGNRGVFTPEVYQNHRLRDRPLVNSNWELIINQRDEAANQDIDLQSLSDIRLYMYYSDFTAL